MMHAKLAATIDPHYRRNLGDGLILRWSSVDDIEAMRETLAPYARGCVSLLMSSRYGRHRTTLFYRVINVEM